jgi:hypothetical protein
MATAAEKDDVALTVGNHDRVPAAVGFHRRSNVMILGCLFLLVGATIPCAVLGTITATERSCELKVNVERDSCHDQVLHAVSAQAYDQVSYAQARVLASYNLTQKHIDYLKNQTGA